MNKVYLIGAGPGEKDYILPKGIHYMKNAAGIIGASRLLPVLKELTGREEGFYPFGKIDETLELAETLMKKGTVAITVSGDPLMYSFFKTIQNKKPDWTIEVVPGIGSLQMLGAAFGMTMEEAAIISVHGRNKTKGSIALAVKEHEKTFFLCGKEQNPSWLSKIMLEYGMDKVTVYAGANLSYEDQILKSGSPMEMENVSMPELSVAMIYNPSPEKVAKKAMLKDEDFIRGKTPMTKEEIRAVIMMKMGVLPDSIVWDIGAGTGSISIECARQCPYGEVHGIEKESDAMELMKKNKEKFEVDQLFLYQGKAMEIIPTLPIPDAVFIGGSGKELKNILGYIAGMDMQIKVVISAVTVETIAECNKYLEIYDDNYQITQLTAGRSRKIGSYHIMDTNNPVMIFEAIL
ncbi:MAG: precorrin-6y C5,15-methyltransferase (decarboxylating) subunit CbiE [Lachnospiraceae bacterium]|nr:precorrin-6y C5,15-methyltransferase (decarboxylating) subunit CbiE [Lachnospiraceae bacterium]